MPVPWTENPALPRKALVGRKGRRAPRSRGSFQHQGELQGGASSAKGEAKALGIPSGHHIPHVGSGSILLGGGGLLSSR